MTLLDTLLTFISHHGLWLVAFLAIFEGPIIAVLAAYLAHQGVFELVPLAVVLVLADLAGDVGYYELGRHGMGWVSHRWRMRLGLRPERLERLGQHFQTRGGQTLLFGKWTHSAGSAILVSAGIARMPLPAFLLYNLVGTIPKTVAFMALGYFAGDAYARIDSWIGRGSWIMLAVLLSAGLTVWLMRGKRSCTGE